jgi:hypothetical protein
LRDASHGKNKLRRKIKSKLLWQDASNPSLHHKDRTSGKETSVTASDDTIEDVSVNFKAYIEHYSCNDTEDNMSLGLSSRLSCTNEGDLLHETKSNTQENMNVSRTQIGNFQNITLERGSSFDVLSPAVFDYKDKSDAKHSSYASLLKSQTTGYISNSDDLAIWNHFESNDFEIEHGPLLDKFSKTKIAPQTVCQSGK